MGSGEGEQAGGAVVGGDQANGGVLAGEGFEREGEPGVEGLAGAGVRHGEQGVDLIAEFWGEIGKEGLGL